MQVPETIQRDMFVTSAGTEVPIIPGYFEKHAPQPAAGDYLCDLVAASKPENCSPLSYSAWVKDLYLYSLMVDTFAIAGVDLRVESMLDVGGGEGTMARLAKLEGRARAARVVELYDMSAHLPDDLFRSHLSRYRRDRMLVKSRIANPIRLNKEEMFGRHGRWPAPSGPYFKLQTVGDGCHDGFLAQNYFEISEQVDLLTAFSCIDYFDPEQFFAKAGDLVRPGGYFFGALAYWWYPVTCAWLYGDFPYAAQRLTAEDFDRYLTERRPEIRENSMRLFNYFHLGGHRPVLDGYLETAHRYGFSPVRAERLMATRRNKLNPLLPVEIKQSIPGGLAAVLTDIQRHRADVRMVDLYTNWILLAMVRR